MRKIRLPATILATAVALCGTNAWAGSHDAESAPVAPGPVQSFDQLDTNHDGEIDPDEWASSESASVMSTDMSEAHYRMYDVDGNGKVDAEEYREVNDEAFDRTRI